MTARVALAFMPFALERKFRSALMKVQNHCCYICGEIFPDIDDWKGVYKSWFRDPRQPNFDHVRPKSKGGANNWRNLLFAHQSCNVDKADRDPFPCELIYLEYAILMLPTSVLSQILEAEQWRAA